MKKMHLASREVLAKVSPCSFKAELLWSPCHKSTFSQINDNVKRNIRVETSLRVCHLVISEQLRAGWGWEEEFLFWSDRAGHSTKRGTHNCVFHFKGPPHHQPWSYQFTFLAERKPRGRREHVLLNPVSLLMAQAGPSQACTALGSFQSPKRVWTNQWMGLTAVDVEMNILDKRALCSAPEWRSAFRVPACPLSVQIWAWADWKQSFWCLKITWEAEN